MLDFLSKNYFLALYAITWFISLFTFRKYFDTSLKYFPILLAYTFFTELLGCMVIYFEDFQLIYDTKATFHSSSIYNIYHFIYYIYFLIVLQKSLAVSKHKKLIYLFIAIFVLVNILNLFIQDPRTTSMVYAYLAGTVLLLITLVIYFKHLITIRNKFVFKYNLLAWISIGLVVFHGIYFPIKIIKEFFTDLYAAAFRDIHIAIVICMYILFCIGFIVGKRRAYR
ncbi:hypothetical protein [Croceivirga radicis]|uniref:hypothetical protein n=1 Tax=Croceivirga radicis TaxID=1929488 RepID=UPI000255B4F9|nr:hypothetical protein [Croceivirga radicis]